MNYQVLNRIVNEEVDRLLNEKAKKGKSKKGSSKSSKSTESRNGDTVNVNRQDQADIKNKITTKSGKHMYNVSAIAKMTGYSQSYVNKCINGGVHSGKEGYVKYKMPKKLATQINNVISKADNA